MKTFLKIISLLLMPLASFAQEGAADAESTMAKHAAGAEKLADEQDELSADVQQLILEQTAPQVIELLEKVDDIMGETTDYLAGYETGGEPIAAQTEIIEKIHEAAKARQQQQGGSKEGGAMMDMMERMMGKKEGEGQGKKPGDKPGEKGGKGKTGDSDAANESEGGTSGGNAVERKIPKAGGTAGKSLPSEFRQALDAYNRGLGEVEK